MVKVVSKKPDECGRVKIRVSANGKRYAVWAMFSGIVRNHGTGAYDQVFIGESAERVVKTFAGDKLISEVTEMAPQVFVVAGISAKVPASVAA